MFRARNLVFFIGLLFASAALAQQGPIAIVIHGGAGTIRKSDMTQAQEAAYRQRLEEAVQAGYRVLSNGGKSLDAVQAAITIMENSPLFNAGKGAVFTHEGTNEMDACIMDGTTLNAGAVSGVKHIRNPILLARAVMDHSRHVLLYGDGAEAFAREQGFEMVENSYFRTEHRWNQLQDALKQDSYGMETEQKPEEGSKQDDAGDGGNGDEGGGGGPDVDHLYSTVGAVALDRGGNIAAATSTGGLTNKRFGRIGDSPIVGAGTYANSQTAGISGTGVGEYFMRQLVAYDISARMEYLGMSLKEAANAVVMDELVKMDAPGGIIGLDHDGNIATVFNTEGMYRAWIDKSGDMQVKIYKDE